LLTFEQIKELIELVARNRLQGIELERSGFRLKIDGQQTAQAVGIPAEPAAANAVPQHASAPAPASMAQMSQMPAAAPVAAAPAAPTGPPPGTHILNSPIVGTFYRQPTPDADPFVEVGARVKKGQVLCIVEAMKLMNEIESDVDGVIAEVYPQNAQAVEFGEPLFAIKTS
jgi:acetyl-CoA carboxylase biotin carboxyl carrier protein